MRKNKGFTLIELLAVIVILGLLMAIAIPSVTKYITESRKKTLTTTLGNYIGALVNDVNDLSYTFTGTNTIYAVPIECIALERGGTDPFGHWYQANDAYFAYVLIQYDDVNSKYVYGFTFKDSAGYGLYPTIQANINEKGSQVKTGYTINKPVTGDLTSLVTLAKWQESGFKVDSNTHLQVLVATSEEQIGDGINTCTLQQKGDNYAQVETEKEEQNTEILVSGTLKNDGETIEVVFGKTLAKNKIEEIYTLSTSTIPNDAIDSWDASTNSNNSVVAYIKDVDHDNLYELYLCQDGGVIAPSNSAALFAGYENATKIDVGNLNTKNVTNMYGMFAYNTKLITLDLRSFNTQNVTNMSAMFGGDQALTSINLSSFNTTKVTDMSMMFSATVQLKNLDLSNFNTSKVTTMYQMFAAMPALETLNISSFNTSNVTNMESMFSVNGISSLDLSHFNTSKVTTMRDMFWDCGLVTVNLSNWDTSNVEDMSRMFSHSLLFTSLNISHFNTSKLKTTEEMFLGTNTLSYVDMSNFDVKNIENTKDMFGFAKTGVRIDVKDQENLNWIEANKTYLSADYGNCIFSVKN